MLFLPDNTIKNDFKYVNGNNMKVNTTNLLDQYFTQEATARICL